MSTRILCKREKLSGNRKTSRQERKFGIEGITAELYIFQGYTEILSEYGAKEKQFAKRYRHRGMFWKQEVLDYIDEKLSQTWSPEQIAKTPCGMKMPSFKTIYRWIDEKYLRSTLKNLRRKGKTRKRMGNGGRFTTGKSIRVSGKGIKAYTIAKNSDIGKRIR